MLLNMSMSNFTLFVQMADVVILERFLFAHLREVACQENVKMGHFTVFERTINSAIFLVKSVIFRLLTERLIIAKTKCFTF